MLALYAVTGKPMMLENAAIDNSAIVGHGAEHIQELLRGRLKLDLYNEILDLAIHESTEFSLEDFLNAVAIDTLDEWRQIKEIQLQMCNKFIANLDGTSGQKIYDKVKREVRETWKK